MPSRDAEARLLAIQLADFKVVFFLARFLTELSLAAARSQDGSDVRHANCNVFTALRMSPLHVSARRRIVSEEGMASMLRSCQATKPEYMFEFVHVSV